MTAFDHAVPAGLKARSHRVRLAKRIRLSSAFVLMAMSGLVWTSFSLFLVALEGEFHWSRAEISGAFSVFALTNALTAPAFGYVLGRWDSRRLLAASSLVLGLALCGLSLVGSPAAYWMVFGVIGGIGSHCISSYAVFAVLAGRFRERPATAMAIADAGSGLATFLGLPVIHWMIVELGWRVAYLILGSSVALIGGALHLLAMDPLRRTHRQHSARPSVRLPLVSLLALAAAYFCGSAAYQGLTTQQIALLDHYGVAESLAVWAVALAGLVLFIWRLTSGHLCDRWGPGKVMIIAAAGVVTTFASVAIGEALAAPGALLVLPMAVGIAFGGQQVLLAASAQLMTRPASLARVLGFCRMASGLGMAAGPLLAGYAFDMTGQYGWPIGLLALMSLGHMAAYTMAFGFVRAKHDPIVTA
ncbi:MFS transporter [Microvirga aerilata]|uniref:MFS transporter n=1 Tax=Microvirga aerilata TaxID=670292 RepID=A0A936Z6H7_9HYPH|nr:MFS transporter [Microvirga aerilata]MBL0403746.1 MFS transporter [Microvirga aerilata]